MATLHHLLLLRSARIARVTLQHREPHAAEARRGRRAGTAGLLLRRTGIAGMTALHLLLLRGAGIARMATLHHLLLLRGARIARATLDEKRQHGRLRLRHRQGCRGTRCPALRRRCLRRRGMPSHDDTGADQGREKCPRHQPAASGCGHESQASRFHDTASFSIRLCAGQFLRPSPASLPPRFSANAPLPRSPVRTPSPPTDTEIGVVNAIHSSVCTNRRMLVAKSHDGLRQDRPGNRTGAIDS